MHKLVRILSLTLIFSVSLWAWDSDKDGIPNKYDECKKSPEDIDNFQDTDGCPEPDNDKDGVCDPWIAEKGQSAKWAKDCKGSDKCPMVPEDRDGFEDDDGCPDNDNDKDGIPDSKDKCPLEEEDFDSFEDTDGCPDPDNDKDGILDADDKCPVDAEDIDKFEDTDGCPELDNDKDGIKDQVDKCPDEAETINGMDDDDGCPDLGTLPIPESQVYPNVAFRVGTDELTFESNRSLDSLAEKLSIFKTKKIKIFNYKVFAKDNAYSLSVLANQQKALIDYLVSKGASEEQIVPIPYTEEWYATVKETNEDPNQKRPIEVHLVDPNAVPADEPVPSETEEEPETTGED